MASISRGEKPGWRYKHKYADKKKAVRRTSRRRTTNSAAAEVNPHAEH